MRGSFTAVERAMSDRFLVIEEDSLPSGDPEQRQ